MSLYRSTHLKDSYIEENLVIDFIQQFIFHEPLEHREKESASLS